MNKARMLVLAIAIGAGAVAAYLASGTEPQPVQEAQQVSGPPSIDVLVVNKDMPLGYTVSTADVEWRPWPADNLSDTLIKKTDQPQAAEKLKGSIVRAPFYNGEPVRNAKLVNPDGSGFMAAILPGGKRAVSTDISPETGAGGFILPNDHVDVVVSQRQKNTETGQDVITSSTVLTNVRVLAIDQTLGEKDGQKVVVGRTATIEVGAGQAEVLSRAKASGAISLALRSMQDARGNKQTSDAGNTITIYRGAGSKDSYSCDPVCR